VTAAVDRVAELQAAGLAASDDGRPALAARHLRAALRILAPEPALQETRGRVLVSLAWAEAERGHVDLGHRLLDEAEPLLAEQRRPVLHAQRAALHERNGRNDLALQEFDLAIAGLTERDSALDLVKALNNRSLLHLDAGHVGPARDDLQRCLRISQRHGIAMGSAMVRLNLGALDVTAGDLPAALREFARARDEFQRIAPGRLSALGVEQARALIAAGLFREADTELAAAIAQAVEQQQGHTYADAVQVRAEAALLAGQPRAAAEWARTARTQFRARRNPRRSALAALLAVRAEFDDAGPVGGLAERARRLAGELRRLGLTEDARVALLVAARCLVRANRSRIAERLITRAGPPARIDSLDTRLLWRLARAEVATAAGQRSQASRHLVAGLQTLHRHRAQLGCLDLRTGTSAHGQDLVRAGLRAALSHGSVPAVYRWSERARAQASLLPPVRPPEDPAAAGALEELRQTRYALRQAEVEGRPAGQLQAQAERLMRTVRERSWSMAGRADAGGGSPAPLALMRQELGDAALVAYLRDGSRLAALVVTGESAAVVPLAGYDAAERSVLRLRADLDTRAGRFMPQRLAEAVAAATVNDAAALTALVLDPLLPLIGDRALVVVPTGLLMTTPWAALPACAGRAVTVASSATAWLAAKQRRPFSGAAVLVAGPGIAHGDQEIRAIAKLHPRAATLTGAAASPAATIAALDGAGIAHLAAHGRHQAENALFSSLELAGGALIGYDLQNLHRPPSMIVLSCCELGLSDVRPGDESFGLASALLAAGTATVVASVSRVADQTAMAVMVSFHRAVTGGASPAAALASAVRDEPDAGFVCLGAG
jgi:tetratricopeptide (TPR) repeat protein